MGEFHQILPLPNLSPGAYPFHYLPQPLSTDAPSATVIVAFLYGIHLPVQLQLWGSHTYDIPFLAMSLQTRLK